MKLVAGVLVKQENKYLLVQEKLPKVYGKWNLPAGHLDQGESLQVAAKREGKEETGLDLEIGKELLVTNDGYAEIHIFEAQVIGGKISYSKSELLDVRWLTTEEIKNIKLRTGAFRKLLV